MTGSSKDAQAESTDLARSDIVLSFRDAATDSGSIWATATPRSSDPAPPNARIMTPPVMMALNATPSVMAISTIRAFRRNFGPGYPVNAGEQANDQQCGNSLRVGR